MLQTPGTAKKHNRTTNTHNAMMINPDGRQSEQLTDQAPGTMETAAEESSRAKRQPAQQPYTPTEQQPLAIDIITQTQHGHRQNPLSQCNPVRVSDGPSRLTIQTPPTSLFTFTFTPLRVLHMHVARNRSTAPPRETQHKICPRALVTIHHKLLPCLSLLAWLLMCESWIA